jgi:chromosome segregation ATPase
MTELEDQNEQLKDRLTDTEDVLARRAEEREDLLDQIEGLHLQLEDEQCRREAESVERSASRAEIYAREEAREDLEGELNHLCDRLARTTLDLEMKEEQVEERDRELKDVHEECQELSMRRDDEWRGELEDAKIRIEELQDVGFRFQFLIEDGADSE